MTPPPRTNFWQKFHGTCGNGKSQNTEIGFSQIWKVPGHFHHNVQYGPGHLLIPNFSPIWWSGATGDFLAQQIAKKKYVSKCLKLPNSSRKVVFSILKISVQNENFSKYFSFWVKIFKIEITTFLDELGNFKHFEPKKIFGPPVLL